MNVRPHDFRRSEGIERGHVRALQRVFETFARQSSAALSSTLHRRCTMRYSGTAEAEWRELAEQLPREPYLAVFSLSPMSGSALLSLPVTTALRMVEFRLGGSERDPYPAHRQMTEIDHGVLVAVVGGVLEELTAAFAPIRRTTAGIVARETNLSLVALTAATEMCLAARFDLALGSDEPVAVVLCMPFSLVRQMTEAIRLAGAPEAGQPRQVVAREQVMRAPLEVRVEIPAVEIGPVDLASLAPGDVARLYHPLERPFDVRVEGVLVARAREGRSGNHVACSILEEV